MLPSRFSLKGIVFLFFFYLFLFCFCFCFVSVRTAFKEYRRCLVCHIYTHLSAGYKHVVRYNSNGNRKPMYPILTALVESYAVRVLNTLL